ncbi:MAG: GTP-binding protein [Saprospiraceae bacterium]
MNKIPVHIITGFLGSGKTTFLNHLIRSNAESRVMVIENEVGQVNIDSTLINPSASGIKEMTAGCICCSLNEELYDFLYELTHIRTTFDVLIIETTGIADPGPVLETFRTGAFMLANYQVQNVICVTDIQNISKSLSVSDEARRQIFYADTILLNKIDLATKEEIANITSVILDIHPGVQIYHGQKNDYPRFDINEPLISRSDKMAKLESSFDTLSEKSHHGMITFSLRYDQPFDIKHLKHTLMILLSTHKEEIFRIKAIIDVADVDHRVILQSVYQTFSTEEGSKWTQKVKRRSIFVFIGRNVDKTGIEKLVGQCMVQD